MVSRWQRIRRAKRSYSPSRDVREIQLAKAAVRGGVETLLVRYGISYDDVHKVYLAGGFGYKLDTEKAIAIGMFPEEFQGKIEAIGNSSLAGAVEYLTEQDSRKGSERSCRCLRRSICRRIRILMNFTWIPCFLRKAEKRLRGCRLAAPLQTILIKACLSALRLSD